VKGKKLPRGAAIGLIVAGDIVLLLMGWFLLVSPQRSTAKSIARSVSATEGQIAEARKPVVQPGAAVQPKQPEIRTAYLYKLSKAMPMTTDMPNLLLELNQVVREAGVQLSSLSPSATDTTGTSTITLTVTGDFYSLTDLLYRLRSLVTVHNGGLDVAGRLFAVKSVGLSPTGTGRELNASIQLNAFTFGGAATATPVLPTPAPADTSGSTASTTTTTSGAAADSAIGP
jgi:Pilus assembly protein, PilO